MVKKNQPQMAKKPVEEKLQKSRSVKQKSDALDVGMENENLAATPGSTQGGTLAGTPGLLEGGNYGHEPLVPDKTVPPYGPMPQAIPMGTDEAILGTTVGDLPEGVIGERVKDSAGENELGSTLGGRPGSTTDYQRTLRPSDLYSLHKRVRDEENAENNQEYR